MTAPSMAGRAQLIGPGACGAVPDMSNTRHSPVFTTRQRIG